MFSSVCDVENSSEKKTEEYPKIKESQNADFGKIKLLIRFHFILFLFHILFSVRVYYLVKTNLLYMYECL